MCTKLHDVVRTHGSMTFSTFPVLDRNWVCKLWGYFSLLLVGVILEYVFVDVRTFKRQ